MNSMHWLRTWLHPEVIMWAFAGGIMIISAFRETDLLFGLAELLLALFVFSQLYKIKKQPIEPYRIRMVASNTNNDTPVWGLWRFDYSRLQDTDQEEAWILVYQHEDIEKVRAMSRRAHEQLHTQ